MWVLRFRLKTYLPVVTFLCTVARFGRHAGRGSYECSSRRRCSCQTVSAVPRWPLLVAQKAACPRTGSVIKDSNEATYPRPLGSRPVPPCRCPSARTRRGLYLLDTGVHTRGPPLAIPGGNDRCGRRRRRRYFSLLLPQQSATLPVQVRCTGAAARLRRALHPSMALAASQGGYP